MGKNSNRDKDIKEGSTFLFNLTASPPPQLKPISIKKEKQPNKKNNK
ncbi:MAG: hypothetical protein K5850_04495 [Bacteroidales bacterium]|nr:hypothetical protein [Bacteroidales bacterium]